MTIRESRITKYLLCFSLLAAVPSGALYAEGEAQLLQQLTPEQKAALQSLPASEKKALGEQYGLKTPSSAGQPEKKADSKPREFSGMQLPPTPESEQGIVDAPDMQPKTAGLRLVGSDFFAASRQRIMAVESAIRQGNVPANARKQALDGYVGPLEMISGHVDTGIPDRYYLSPGDTIELTWWSSDQQFRSQTVVVEDDGSVEIPDIGRFVARGMTLQQFEDSARDHFLRVSDPMDFQLVATMDRLKSIQVDIRGHAFRPGSYSVSSITTLFNALMACGGPDDEGSLRNITLLRGGESISIDFYDYLLKGRNEHDYALQGGDIIFIPYAGRKVALAGKVYQQGIYELRKKESIESLISLAGGTRPDAKVDQVEVMTIIPDQGRTLKTINLKNAALVGKLALHDGDSVMIPGLVLDAQNYATISGNVFYPGRFEISKGMRISALLKNAQLMPDTEMQRAILFRKDAKNQKITRFDINLSALKRGDASQDMVLQDLDELRIYSKSEASFTPLRQVELLGYVQRPGSYSRSDDMHLRELLFEAGGLLPGYDDTLTIARARSSKEVKIVNVSLDAVMNGDPEANLVLYDGDVITVRKYADFYDKPAWVTVKGQVNIPGPYPLKDRTVSLREVIQQAGGFTKSAYPKGLVLRRNSQYMRFDNQTELLEQTNENSIAVLRNAFQREQARNYAQLESMKAANSNGKAITDAAAIPSTPIAITNDTAELKKSMAASTIPLLAQGGEATSNAAFSLFESSPSLGVSMRVMKTEALIFDGKERIVLNIEDVMSGKSDILLRPGDEITVPELSQSVGLVGAVSAMSAISYKKGENVKYYVRRVGGYDEDADRDRVRVIRMDGSVMLAKDIGSVEPGDIIFVPTRVMTADIKSGTDKILDVVKYSVSTAAGLAIFFSLINAL